MDENKEFQTLEEQFPEIYGTTAEAAEENMEMTEETAAEETKVAAEQVPVEEPAPTVYRGAGAGRKESPFANSPYVMHHSQPRQEPVYETPKPEYIPEKKPRKGKKGLGRRIIACAAALALLASSCGLTAHLVNRRWEQRFDALEENFRDQVQAVQMQVNQLTPQSTGISVSGTVAEGLTAGQVYARNVRAVVLIESSVVTTMGTGTSTGSGFIISQDGYVVTNHHVIEGASAVKVVLCDGKTYPAAVVGYDSTNDIALLKVEASGLTAVELGSSDDLIVGDQVVAIGNPLGELTSTLTVGYVSAKERTVSTDGTVINMIQTDAAINSGNSGGPLFNMKGQVVGITTAKYSGASSSGATIEGIGFAIPIDDVLEELEELREFGYIKSAYLGVMVQNMDASTAGIYGLPVGAYVVGVEEGYCAAKAGIRAKDIIVAVEDEKVQTITDLTRLLRDYEPGDKAKLTVYRSGQYLNFVLVLDERPADADSKTTQQQPQQQMPEGSYEDWFNYFAPFFGWGDD